MPYQLLTLVLSQDRLHSLNVKYLVVEKQVRNKNVCGESNSLSLRRAPRRGSEELVLS